MKPLGLLRRLLGWEGGRAKAPPDAKAMTAMAQRHFELGNAHRQDGRPTEALACYREALRIAPRHAAAAAAAGSACMQLARNDAAQAYLRRALEIEPDNAEAQWNLMFSLLLDGDYAAGLPLHERRFQVGPAAQQQMSRDILAIFGDIPRWQGEPLHGRNLLLWTEQGLGDSLMMLRYLPLIAERFGGTVDLWCEPELLRIAQTCPGVRRVVSKDEPLSLPANVLHCPTLSLPCLFGTTLQTIPDRVPYLSVPAEAQQPWQKRLRALDGLKVGLVWAGRPSTWRDSLRSVDFARLAPLLAVVGVSFVSLQKGAPASPLVDWMDECTDFFDTAALLSGLDLVIGVDTAVIHLAGALGKPVWLLNRYESEWRWLLEREDSPWYPTLRIFRQPALHDWDSVVAEVAAALRARVAG